MDHFGPFWSREYQNPVRNKAILTKMVKTTILDHFGPVHFPTVLRRLLINGVVCSNTLFSNTSSLTNFGRPLKTTFDMTTLIFSSGGCPSYPFYPLKRVPSYPFLAESPSSEGATKDHLSSKPPQGEPPGTKIEVDVS